MYEEEDDDLPAQYRRLTAHLQTGSLDFNRRFHAYLLSQTGARHQVASLDTSAGAGLMQYPNAPYFANPMQPFSPQVISPTAMPSSPQSYRHTPYPVAASPTVKMQHQRSASISTPNELQKSQQSLKSPQPNFSSAEEFRRSSMPSHPGAAQTPKAQSAQARPPLSRNASVAGSINSESSALPPAINPPSQEAQQNSNPFPDITSPIQHDGGVQSLNFSPFSMSMPLESQMFINPGMEPFNPNASMFMPGNYAFPQPFSYTYNPNLDTKTKPSTNTSTGINQTLAPAGPALDAGTDFSYGANQQADLSCFGNGMFPSLTPSHSLNFDQGVTEPLKAPGITRANSFQGSADGNNDWASMINSNMWEEAAN